MTGAELRAWRERLGKDEAWAMRVLMDVATPYLGSSENELDGVTRLAFVERGVGSMRGYTMSQDAYVAAYRAALESEEARQAAERGPVEPVCPEGVRRTGDLLGVKGQGWQLRVDRDGTIMLMPDGGDGEPFASPDLLEYAAALSRYRAAQHAASDKQRKLDAVRAAEEKCEKAKAASLAATDAFSVAVHELTAARREAGL